jgi:hypothetical protein
VEEQVCGLKLTMEENNHQSAGLNMIIHNLVAVEAATISLNLKYEREIRKLIDKVEEMRLKLERCQGTHHKTREL